MFLTVHVATGAAVSTIIQNPLATVPVAFVSHFALDAIPHWHDIIRGDAPTKKTIKIATTDFLVAIALAVYSMLATENMNLLYGMVAGSVMDTDVVLYPLFEKKGWKKLWPSVISKLHGGIQNETKSLWGLLPQALVLLASIAIITYYA